MRGKMLVLWIGLAIACATERGVSFSAAFDIAPGTSFPALNGARFGGLSGLAYDAAAHELLAISDDHDNTRVIRLRVEDQPFRVTPIGVIPLTGTPVGLDPEGIVLLADGHLLISSDGFPNAEPRQPPGIFEFSHDGAFIRALELRDKYLPPPSGPISHGVRGNTSFESLTLTADRQTLYTGTETALTQDGDAATFDHGALSRILEYRLSGDRFVPGREWLYEIDPVGRPAFDVDFFVTGLVELAATDSGDLLALERSYAREPGESGRELNRIRLYRVTIDGATDVSSLDSIAGQSGLKPVTKQLLLDFGKIPGLPSRLAGLDNFEGLALLPPQGGRRPLLVVSDDNFSNRQRTWFVRLMIGS